MIRNDLEKMSKDELIELVLKLQRPATTSRTSSKPPSSDRKTRRKNSKPGGARPGHKGHSRTLSQDVDEIVDHKPGWCCHCGAGFASSELFVQTSIFEHIDLPVIRPQITHHRCFQTTCNQCGKKTKAAPPQEAAGSPFGPGITSLAVYFKHFHHVSYERLQGLFCDLFGLKLSQGALVNMVRRSGMRFTPAYDKAVASLRKAPAVASDETGVRIEGISAQHWIFISPNAVVHKADFSRSAQVVRDMMDGHVPDWWLSDRYSAQQKHGKRHQTCLAHIARDIARVLEVGDEVIGVSLKSWMTELFQLARQLKTLAASTIKQKQKALEKTIDRLINMQTSCDVTSALLRKIANARDQLFTFLDAPDLLEPTNNDAERKLRPSVIARKVSNGFRAKWAADADAIIRSVIDTASLSGQNRFQTIKLLLS